MLSPHSAAAAAVRRFPRFHTYLDAALAAQGSLARGTVLSVSEGGLFVATAMRVPPGTPVAIRFRLPEGGDAALSGWVIYQAQVHERFGLGLKFSRADGHAAVGAIRSWCEEYIGPQ